MSEVVISVRGEHEAHVFPERATVRLTVQTEGPSRGPVVERVAALALPVREALEERKTEGSVHEWSSQRVAVWASRPWADGRQLALVHYASVEFSAVFTDFAALSWWIGEIAEQDGVQIDNVLWALSPETARSTEAEVASEAVKVAVARATAYAAAIGLGTVTPLEIADVGLLARAEPEASAPKMMRAMGMHADSTYGDGSIDLQPSDIVVAAAVEARFSAR